MSTTNTLVRWIVSIGALLIVVTTAGMLADIYVEHSRFLSITMAAVAIISFIGFLRLGYLQEGTWGLNEAGMRMAITGATITVYLVLVSIVAFFGPPQAGDLARLDPLTETMIQSFTSLTSIVVGFYFGSSALVAVAGKIQRSREGASSPPDSNSPQMPPPTADTSVPPGAG